MPRSTYFYHRQSSGQADQYADVKQQIKAIYHQHKGCYGYRRITLALRHLGYLLNHKCVLRLMQMMGLKSRIRLTKYRSYRGKVGNVADNLLQRQFNAVEPNQKWVTDVTEFNVRGEKLYLSPIMDLFNGEIIAYQTQRRPTFSLVKQMLDHALIKLQPHETPLLHSDQGWQYQMRYYQHALKQRGLTISMSRTLRSSAAHAWIMLRWKASLAHSNQSAFMVRNLLLSRRWNPRCRLTSTTTTLTESRLN